MSTATFKAIKILLTLRADISLGFKDTYQLEGAMVLVSY